jgi:hypothetical protein
MADKLTRSADDSHAVGSDLYGVCGLDALCFNTRSGK